MIDRQDSLPISVLLFHPADGFGGAERTSMNVAKYSDPAKVRYVVVTGPRAFRENEGVRFFSLFDLGLSNGFVGFRKALSDARRLCALTRQEGCHVALGMLHYGALVVVLMRFVSGFRIRSIASPRTPSVLGIEFHVGRAGRRALKWRGLVAFFCRFSDRVVVASMGLKRECVRVFGANPRRVIVIPNGVECGCKQDFLKPVEAEATGCAVPRILAVGRLAPEKDFSTLLSAFAKARPELKARLVIMGEGPEREALRRLVGGLNIADCTEFRGFCPRPFAWAEPGDIFVHTALFEGFGNVLLEAMAYGLPVVATDCDFGPREIVQHGVNGLLVPVGDAERLALSLVTLSTDADLRARLVDAGFETVKRFGVERMAKEYERVIVSLAGYN